MVTCERVFTNLVTYSMRMSSPVIIILPCEALSEAFYSIEACVDAA